MVTGGFCQPSDVYGFGGDAGDVAQIAWCALQQDAGWGGGDAEQPVAIGKRADNIDNDYFFSEAFGLIDGNGDIDGFGGDVEVVDADHIALFVIKDGGEGVNGRFSLIIQKQRPLSDRHRFHLPRWASNCNERRVDKWFTHLMPQCDLAANVQHDRDFAGDLFFDVNGRFLWRL